ncbi:hypothetical protein [Pseudomonas sp. Sample_23]|jgi:hypothetical protein|uniref:hemagglutinin repeat-containing protein n=1 Tax=Pseudomonas sp. Sample_23 TaxID=2448267 RepID=UPI001032C3A7|nr:hypothetical protein [Pseudomonas sp. Sample_23]
MVDGFQLLLPFRSRATLTHIGFLLLTKQLFEDKRGQTTFQLASSVKGRGDLRLDAGRDINVIASIAEATGNLTAEAKRDISLSLAGDEHKVETHSRQGSFFPV